MKIFHFIVIFSTKSKKDDKLKLVKKYIYNILLKLQYKRTDKCVHLQHLYVLSCLQSVRVGIDLAWHNFQSSSSDGSVYTDCVSICFPFINIE